MKRRTEFEKKNKKKKKIGHYVIRTHAHPRRVRAEDANRSDATLCHKIKVLINIYDAVLKILWELIEHAPICKKSKAISRWSTRAAGNT